MTIGRNSTRSSVRSSIRAPKFLDKSGGFYGRLEESEVASKGKQGSGEGETNKENAVDTSSTVVNSSETDHREEVEVFGFNEGMMEDDGETLLHRKPSRLSGRWRRSSRRKQKVARHVEEDNSGKGDCHGVVKAQRDTVRNLEEDCHEVSEGEKERQVVHFHVREEADDQVLIRDKKRGREEEGEEERRVFREQEEGMKMAKRKNYKKALDRVFRRGWDAFITNLYSITLTPVTSSTPPSPSFKKKLEHSAVLAELR